MRIWFNHWFSTAYHFIDMLKAKGHYIIASNERSTCIYKTNANEFYEDIPDGDNYVDFCLKFCKIHNIEVFFPKRGMSKIIERLEEFNADGIKVICEQDFQKYNLLQDKYLTGKWFKQHVNNIKVPDMRLCNNLREFEENYLDLIMQYKEVCIKYNKDEGGLSYKKINNQELTPNLCRVLENHGREMNLKYLISCLKEQKFPPLLLMPYLGGNEISIDCLSMGNNFIAVPRYKLSNRITRIEMDKNLIEIAKNFQEEMNLTAPYNIQLRTDNNGNQYLLEVNTRLSGGSWKAKFIGIEFPALCLNKVIGNLEEIPIPTKRSMDISNIEYAIPLN